MRKCRKKEKRVERGRGKKRKVRMRLLSFSARRGKKKGKKWREAGSWHPAVDSISNNAGSVRGKKRRVEDFNIPFGKSLQEGGKRGG